ncbi:SdiA-regulated domain-containing protein [Hymenobacter lapidiphilus]|uniref:SdiA-regulated domain-containing protein n=1 Tax=Hymenobacter lapidiphilus TaxID=2608003 RepID=A0A7Y7PR29_9BACT|nr:SdiA-regulated domain-containing protein [Hymenobacter lapidiphilus]NVO32484.1 SdiA-regulated domain-containing protein [Hymenobacter lapidiphilus]
MRAFLFVPALAATLISGCSEAQTNQSEGSSMASETTGQSEQDGKKGKKGKATDIANLTQVGKMDEVPESSGLALTGENGTFFTHGDDGNQPILYKIDTEGEVLARIEVAVKSQDWESVTRDNTGNVYIGDVGNNNNDRKNLVIYRLNPLNPQIVQEIKLKYPDQTEFAPKKKDRNFDCEATLWHDGQVYLFTKDRGRGETSKVYTVPDQPGSYTAQLRTKLAIPGQVTDAALSPDGRRLVLLAREEMFVFEGENLAAILKAKPTQISLKGAGQTEGAVFTSNQTLYISTEQGRFYTYQFE